MLLGTDQTIFLANGNGTEMMQLVVDNLFWEDARILVINGGAFSDRFIEVLEGNPLQGDIRATSDSRRISNRRISELKVKIGKPADTNELARMLSTTCFDAVVVVHCETSNGELCDLEVISRTVRELQPEALLVVDALTSVAAHEICFDEWGIDAMIGASHKVIGGPLGIGFIGLSERAFYHCKNLRRCNNFLRMLPYHLNGQSEFALAQNVFFGFEKALEFIVEEIGPAEYRRQVQELASVTRRFLTNAGMDLVPHSPANAVTCFWLPENVKATELERLVEEKYDIPIVTGRGDYVERIVRIGHLGLHYNTEQLNQALPKILKSIRILEYEGRQSASVTSSSRLMSDTLFQRGIPCSNSSSSRALFRESMAGDGIPTAETFF